ncbi:glutathione S-transferase omega-1-like [Dendropsophus ebraccatus]|uniref:glutathione S-transferase omega-1-like n=1 Tax=Dendropsophus ebraccatus TaxID=150705 RepID=UPI003831127B
MTGSQRSLGKGSAAPGPVPEGLIRLYSMRFCPFAKRARLLLLVKGIKHEIININLKNKPEWFFEKSPLGYVPSLETPDGKIIYESPIICDYLDEAYPGKKLTPADPYEKAQQRMLLELFNVVSAVMYKVLYARRANQDVTQLKVEFFEKFKKLDEALAKRNSAYFGGPSASMVDYMMWPWLERLLVFDVVDYLEKVPHIRAWHKLMLQDPAVKATFIEPEVMLAFSKLFAQNSVDAVDYGLD